MALIGVRRALIKPKRITASGDAAQTTAFLARTSGLSGTETAAYKALINGLVADGIWSLLDALYIFATNTSITANLNLVSTSFGITNHSATFTADVGYQGNGSSQYLDTGYTPSTAAGVATLNSFTLGTYTTTSRTTGGANYAMGEFDGANNYAIVPLFSDSHTYGQIASSSASSVSTVANAKGLTVGSRTASNLTTVYKFDGVSNGSLGTDTSSPGGALGTISITLQAQNQGGGPNNFNSDTFTSAFIGAGLNSTQVGQMSSRLNAYMTALGINAY